jgi:D-aminopeptidase
MCHVSAGNQVSQMNTYCDCECGCPVMLPTGDEIRRREDHKKILQDRIEMIDKKIASLKTVNEP